MLATWASDMVAMECEWSGVSTMTSCTPNPPMLRRERWMVRMGWASGDNAANLLATTRTCQGPLPLAGTRITSVGVLISLPMQNGQASTNGVTILAGRLVANSSGRLARSVDNNPFLSEIVLAQLGHI